MQNISRETNTSLKVIETWFRKRRIMDKPSQLKKFCETSWKALFQTSMLAFGTIILWNKDWFWEVRYCWHGAPNHLISADIWLYYVLELAYFTGLMLTQSIDAKTSDFWELFIHHIATIILINFSYACNMFRFGSLVMWIHGFSDVILDNGKIINHLGWHKMANLLFALLALTFHVTRLGYFPTWLIYSLVVEAPQMIETQIPCIILLAHLLVVLIFLHFFWFYLIAKMGWVIYCSNNQNYKRIQDVRTDDSEDEA